MRMRYIPALVTLTAGTITCIISIIRQEDVLSSLKLLLLVLIIFYMIGCIAKTIIAYAIQMSGRENITDNEPDRTQSENSDTIDEHSEAIEE